ncbi:MAG: TVP38/TMEM64 family protein [Aureispira sp.]
MTNPKKKLLLRISLLMAVMLGLIALAKYTPLGAYFDLEALQILIQQAGNWGILLYLLIFLLGTLMNVPGAVFVIFAVLTYGWGWGTLLAYSGAVICALINFWVARFLGGQSLAEIKNKRLQKALSRIDTHPIQTVCWLRVFMLLSPLINYALALTPMKSRQFLIANSLAMVFPMLIILGGTFLFQSTYFQEVVLVWFRTLLFS